MSAYPFKEIEAKWQAYWDRCQTFRVPAEVDRTRPKYYVLDMFPYPSGDGLHVGHPEGYTASDIIARYKRMRGFNVLHPIGWDAFGLPAEQYALRTGTHPRTTTERNVVRFRSQLKSLGFSYDWSREINTTDPAYYKWTQWIFKQLFERGLAYQEEKPVWWCPELGTTLANEEVIDGKSEVGGFECVRRPLRQWVLRITEYAEALLSGLDDLDWPQSTKEMQRNWIGRSEGIELEFPLVGVAGGIRVFTTRPDTLFGATYMVLAPEHPLVDSVTTVAQRQSVDDYRTAAATKSELERTDLQKDKTGVFTGGHAFNPASGEEIPVWVADYVLADYGTGAIMAVPGEDERDWEFAERYGLPIIRTVQPPPDFHGGPWLGDGLSINSGFLDGLDVAASKAAMIDWLERQGHGERKVNYKLRDWLFSRQRYWGEPFPIVFVDDEPKAVADAELPVKLPDLDRYEPSGTAEGPLANAGDWLRTVDGAPPANRRGVRPTPCPQWAGSLLVLPSLHRPGQRRGARGRGTGALLDARRSLRGRGGARGPAPALRPLLAQGALRRRDRLHAGAVCPAGPPGHDPRRVGVRPFPGRSRRCRIGGIRARRPRHPLREGRDARTRQRARRDQAGRPLRPARQSGDSGGLPSPQDEQEPGQCGQPGRDPATLRRGCLQAL